MIERRLHTTRVFTTALPAPLLFRGWISGLLVRGFAVCPRAREVQGQAVLAVLAVLGRNAQQAARCALRVAPGGCARCGASAAALYLPARAGLGLCPERGRTEDRDGASDLCGGDRDGSWCATADGEDWKARFESRRS